MRLLAVIPYRHARITGVWKNGEMSGREEMDRDCAFAQEHWKLIPSGARDNHIVAIYVDDAGEHYALWFTDFTCYKGKTITLV